MTRSDKSNNAVPRVVFAMTGAEAVPGGVSQVNLHLLSALARLQRRAPFELRVLSFLEDKADRPASLPEKAEFRAFGGRKPAFASALVREAQPGTLFLFDYVRIATPLLWHASRGRIRTVVFAHGDEYWRNMRLTDRWSLLSARLVLANSHYTLRRMQDAIGNFHGIACPLGLPIHVQLNEFQPVEANAGPLALVAADGEERQIGGRAFLLTARINSSEGYKGHMPLLEALPAVLARFPDAQLIFPGPGDGHYELLDRATELGVASQVFLPGFVAWDLLQDLYRRCYAFTMPSTCEGFGLAHLEAMNYGKACVACRDDGAEDVVVHEETGLLIPQPVTPAKVSAALLRLLEDPALNAQLGKCGFLRLHKHFTAERFQERLLAALAPLIFPTTETPPL